MTRRKLFILKLPLMIITFNQIMNAQISRVTASMVPKKSRGNEFGYDSRKQCRPYSNTAFLSPTTIRDMYYSGQHQEISKLHGDEQVIDTEDVDNANEIPVGAKYELTVRLPFIGKQRFSLRILSSSVAELKVSGVLQIYDIIRYSVHHEEKKSNLSQATNQNKKQESSSLRFALSKKTINTMQRFRTTLDYVEYSKEMDTPIIIVTPPLKRKIRMELKRVTQDNINDCSV